MEVKKFPNALVVELSRKMKSILRKTITGNENIKVRDHIKKHKGEPKYIKFFDKIFFTLGLVILMTCQFFVLSLPNYFWIWYCATIPMVWLGRIIHFTINKYGFFLIDFCYFNLAWSFLSIFVESHQLFKIGFIFSCAVGFAIVVWRVSLVFHDFDKMTSVYIHIFPPMLYYSMRWTRGYEILPLNIIDFIYAIGGYIFWQMSYYLITEVIVKDKLDKNPDLQTSLRYLSADIDNGTTKVTLKLCRYFGIMDKNEVFNPTSIKTKCIFMGTQFLYTCTTFSIAPVLYNSRMIHLLFLGMLTTVATYNGASFYIEVFSKRYQQQLENKKYVQQVAVAAAQASYEAVSAKKQTHTQNTVNNSKAWHAVEESPARENSAGIAAAVDELTPRSEQEFFQAATNAFISEAFSDSNGLEIDEDTLSPDPYADNKKNS